MSGERTAENKEKTCFTQSSFPNFLEERYLQKHLWWWDTICCNIQAGNSTALAEAVETKTGCVHALPSQLLCRLNLTPRSPPVNRMLTCSWLIVLRKEVGGAGAYMFRLDKETWEEKEEESESARERSEDADEREGEREGWRDGCSWWRGLSPSTNVF